MKIQSVFLNNRYYLIGVLVLFVTIPCLSLIFTSLGAANMKQNEMMLYDFREPDQLNDWLVVNDGVMGGLSKSKIMLSDSSTAIFQGMVSLENFGGFTSTRTRPRSYELDGYSGIMLRVKGDGKKYQLRLQTDNRFDGISYRCHFGTEAGSWTIIRVPFRDCVPVFRGRILRDVEPVSAKQIQQIGFLIADKQAGTFKLEIDWIKAYKE